ncbi:hypothetical protein [Paenibacillus sinopodophylli]|uniref:hypothetical protein n=1 Tax=Paenibacillus sinopodophylli TaxID=1837342 RepID=UPI00110D215B|nr:hypothetical protein [Paenibacillus sinopodophylli]
MERLDESKVADRRSQFVPLLLYGLLVGTISGAALGLVMKLFGEITGTGIYVLLLNVDFIAWLPHPMTERFEFVLHMLVALPIGILFIAMLRVWTSPLGVGLGMGAAIACCTWIPLTQMSERTPSTADLAALSWWIAGHLVYGVVLAGLGFIWMMKGWDKR